MKNEKGERRNDMKRFAFFVLVFTILAIDAFGQQQRTISVFLAYNLSSSGTYRQYIRLTKSGDVEYAPKGSWTNSGDIMWYGNYYVDQNNVVHITWNNGFQETFQISYNSEGLAICEFRGYSFYEYPEMNPTY